MKNLLLTLILFLFPSLAFSQAPPIRCFCELGHPCICTDGNCVCPTCLKNKKGDPFAKGNPGFSPRLDTYVQEGTGHPPRVVLVFGAKWCEPCNVWKSTVLEDLRRKGYSIGTGRSRQIRVFDADDNKEFVKSWNVESLPTFIFLDDVRDNYSVERERRSLQQVPSSIIQKFLDEG